MIKNSNSFFNWGDVVIFAEYYFYIINQKSK